MTMFIHQSHRTSTGGALPQGRAGQWSDPDVASDERSVGAVGVTGRYEPLRLSMPPRSSVGRQWAGSLKAGPTRTDPIV